MAVEARTFAYAYRAPRGALVGFGAVALIATFLGWDGMEFRGVPIPAQPSRVVLGLICALWVVSVLGAVWIERTGAGRTLDFDATGVSVWARPWHRAATTVPYREITELATRSVARERFLEIRHRGGKVTINGACMSPADFDAACALFDEVFAE